MNSKCSSSEDEEQMFQRRYHREIMNENTIFADLEERFNDYYCLTVILQNTIQLC